MAAAVSLNPVYLPVNQGHGNARRASLKHCRNNLVALMDADDISLPNRFEKQLERFLQDAELHIVGGQITEFIHSPENITGERVVPEEDAAIKAYMKRRCPMNQVSVMMKRDFAEQVGGYIDWYCEEDYYLWLRMALAGGRFANVPDVLVNVRIGDEMSARRGGWKYFRSEAKLQKYMLKNKVISFPRYCYNVALRFGGEVLIGDKMRTRLFRWMRPAPPAAAPDTAAAPNAAAAPGQDDAACRASRQAYPPFSVAMCVYGGDNAEWFDAALASVIHQTVLPNEIVLVVDGPVPDAIQNVIQKYADICAGGVITTIFIRFEENQGHGNARRAGLEACTNELVALMDADDICVGNRFEQQLNAFAEGCADIVGGDISEFIGETENVVAYRTVPTLDPEIKAYMKKRCPFNQMTVMFRKSAVQEAGGYLDWYCDEDYYLWLRMAQNGCVMQNTGTVLVNARVGKEMYNRRGGRKYFRSEAKLQKYMLNNRMIGFGTYLSNVSKRFLVQVLLPNRIRGWVFRKFARKKV